MREVVTESVEQVRSGETSVDVNVDVVMEVCVFVLGVEANSSWPSMGE